MIHAKNVSKRVQVADSELCILKGTSLEIKRGESVAIIGPSGSGKSTLLGLLAGLDEPTDGDIWLAGEHLNALDEDGRAALRARLVGFVFQSFQLLPGLTAQENVMLPLELRGDRSAAEVAKDYLNRVGLGHRLDHYPRQLSGGEQQRVALARAFAPQPDILFADEPTGNLDADTGASVNDLLFSLNAQSSTTLVLVTHEPILAKRCARRITLAAGEIMEDTGEALPA
ncbi:ABC transporter ATP-binding protein [Litorivivens lipolytica]|uniref:ABC transporter ATP-binding protein n=1 Tax=Litorivivens lipolytica TaxID=1524264 RepID=UPI001615EFCE|nr:ABC transporter ATP-binding protein [Litorivivens lipolytica]